jgi:hypothetical protein
MMGGLWNMPVGWGGGEPRQGWDFDHLVAYQQPLAAFHQAPSDPLPDGSQRRLRGLRSNPPSE